MSESFLWGIHCSAIPMGVEGMEHYVGHVHHVEGFGLVHHLQKGLILSSHKAYDDENILLMFIMCSFATVMSAKK